jgi:hypothetical protein
VELIRNHNGIEGNRYAFLAKKIKFLTAQIKSLRYACWQICTHHKRSISRRFQWEAQGPALFPIILAPRIHAQVVKVAVAVVQVVLINASKRFRVSCRRSRSVTITLKREQFLQ